MQTVAMALASSAALSSHSLFSCSSLRLCSSSSSFLFLFPPLSASLTLLLSSYVPSQLPFVPPQVFILLHFSVLPLPWPFV